MPEEENANLGVEPEPTEPEPAFEAGVQAPEPEPPVEPESAEPEPSGPGLLRRILVWAVVVLLVFALGVGACWLTQVQPQRDRIASLEQRAQSAEAQVASLQAEVTRLSPFEAENESLQAQLKRSSQHLDLLFVLVDVTSAQLAMAQEDAVAAKAALTGTDARLSGLESDLEGSQADTVKGLRERLTLVKEEVDSDEFAARRDLEILANNLLSLERSLFGD
ncbi:MAG: hypothetical protein P8X64_00040 [Anaerolineales bacterium]|jgi:hypothetical protein